MPRLRVGHAERGDENQQEHTEKYECGHRRSFPWHSLLYTSAVSKNVRPNGTKKMDLCGTDHQGPQCGGGHSRLSIAVIQRVLRGPLMADDARVSESIDVVKLGANIGARIDGVRLSADLGGETVAAINAALLEHKVIFFRGQHDLEDDGQLAFAGKLGTPTTAHPTLSRGKSVLPIDSRYERPIAGTPTSPSSTESRKHLCCGRFRCPATAVQQRGRRRRRPTSSCRPPCARLPKTCGPCTPMNMTTPPTTTAGTRNSQT